MAKLSARKVETIKTLGRYGDGDGLWLQVSKLRNEQSHVTKSWLLRYMLGGKARQMGLGSVKDFSLADARKRAREARQLAKDGTDPIDVRKERRDAAKLEAARAITFKAAAERYIDAHKAGWKNPKHAEQWPSSLASYAYDIIGDLPVASIDKALVLKVLEPIWKEKPETAKRLRGRIETILDWAAARDFRRGENPARWKGHLDKLLVAPGKIRPVRHHPALPYSDMPAFMAELRARDGVSARALEFTVLTATRTNEVIGARWSEIDFALRVWTVPASRMKAGREHRVPLSDRAIVLLQSVPRERGSEFIFVGSRKRAPLSNMAMLELMKRIRPGFVPHGFRSTFRDWAAERTSYPNHIVEKALAHAVADKVEAAYRRGDLFDKRARLMTEWARWCVSSPTDVTARNVAQLRQREPA